LRICPPDHWPSDFKGRDRSEGAVGRLLPGTMPKRPQRGLEQVPEEEEAGNSLTWGRLTFSRVEFINHLEFFSDFKHHFWRFVADSSSYGWWFFRWDIVIPSPRWKNPMAPWFLGGVWY
jgi:hypothetical protein